MSPRTGAQALVEALVTEGVEVLFGIPGVGTLSVYDAFCDHPQLRHIETRHEQGAVFMADGYARATGRPGVAFTSGGPGAFNTMTAMGTAFNDSVPVLHIVNENPASVRRKGRGHFHDMSDQFGMFRPVTGFGQQVLLSDEIPLAIHQAMFALRSRRPRPALVEIAGEALTTLTDAPIPEPAASVKPLPDLQTVEAAVRLIAAASSPLIWAGGGIATREAALELQTLAERMGAPVITTQKGKGAIAHDHPLHLGNWANEPPVQELINRSDLLVAVGTRFSYFPTGGWALRLPERIVQIDLDPAEIGRNYPVSVGLMGDAAPTLHLLNRGMAAGSGNDRKAEVAEALAAVTRSIGPAVELEVLDQIRAALPDEALVYNDPTTLAFWARGWWRTRHPRTWFIPSGFGTLGYALPAAIGGATARPDLPVVAIAGDAGAMFTIQELMTAVQENVSVVYLVFNDRGYGVERRHQDHLYGRRSGVDILPPDFVALARACGARGLLVDDLSQVGTTLEAVIGAPGPVLIEIPGQFRHPGYGSFASSPSSKESH